MIGEQQLIPDDTAEGVGKRVSEQLLAFYAEREGSGKSSVLRERIQQAFLTLQRSRVAKAVEHVLCCAIQSEQFAYRYAALDLVILHQWESMALVNALIASWRTYAAPSGSLLTAFVGIWRRQPALFVQASLPMRQLMTREPQLWEQVTNNPTWQAIFRILYLPPGADFSPASIYLDSPLTLGIETLLL